MSKNVVVVGSVAYDIETPTEAARNSLGSVITSVRKPVCACSTGRRRWQRLCRPRPRHPRRPRDRRDRVGHRHHGRLLPLGGRYHENMNDRTTLYTHLNVFERFQPELPATYRDEQFVFLGNIDPALQLDVLDQMNGPRFVALDTMNFWIEGLRRAYLDKVLGKVDGLIVNDEEAKLLTGAPHPVAWASAAGLRPPYRHSEARRARCPALPRLDIFFRAIQLSR